MTMTSGSEMEQGPKRERTPNLSSSDPYAVLGLARGASPGEVRQAYFDLVREYPPEHHPDTFKAIRAAYEKLRTADAKAETDLFLFQPPPPWEPRKRKKKLDLAFQTRDAWLVLFAYGELSRMDFKSDHRPVRL
ncbi:MAG: J domain-containing protein [Anaerolineae bacterium]|nr:J domain-containing protein [Anaerolineae bacterium]